MTSFSPYVSVIETKRSAISLFSKANSMSSLYMFGDCRLFNLPFCVWWIQHEKRAAPLHILLIHTDAIKWEWNKQYGINGNICVIVTISTRVYGRSIFTARLARDRQPETNGGGDGFCRGVSLLADSHTDICDTLCIGHGGLCIGRECRFPCCSTSSLPSLFFLWWCVSIFACTYLNGL